MGSNMVNNLIKAGHELVLYDTQPLATKTIVDGAPQGRASTANSPLEVAQQVDRVITMVPTPQHVLDVYLGSEGILSGGGQPLASNTILMDSSTIDPATSRHVAQAANAKGVVFLDAPVSGAVPAARAATLTFMVGGPADQVDRVRPLLLAMGKNVIHTGAEVGSGVTAKLCNNMMLAISMIGTSEVLNLGQRLGLDPQLLTTILNISSGRTWVSEIYNPVEGVGDDKLPANHGYANGFGVGLIAKDLNLAQSIAVASQSPTPMGALASQVYRLLQNNGHAGKDFSYVYKFLQEQNATK